MDWTQLGPLADKLGAMAILLAVAFAIYKDWLVTGSQYRQEVESRKREEARAERAEARADRLETTLDTATKALSEQTSVNARTTTILEVVARGKGHE